MKYLGLILDKNLTWESHIKELNKKLINYTLTGVSESTDGRGCAILALEVVPKNLIFT